MFSSESDSNLQNSKTQASRFSIYQVRIEAVQILRALKSFMSYRELSKIFDSDPSTLSRYISGHALPSIEKAEFIIAKSMNKSLLLEIIRNKKEGESQNVIDPNLISIFSYLIHYSFLEHNVNKILAFAYRDALFGFSLALTMGAKLILAFDERSNFPNKRYEYSYSVIEPKTGNVIRKSIALAKNSIKQRDKILIVGSFLKIPEDYIALCTLIKRARSEAIIAGFAFLKSESESISKDFEKKIKGTLKDPAKLLILL